MSRVATPDEVLDRTRRPSPRTDGWLALAGVGTFATLVLALHVVEDDFRPCCRFISEYVLGDWGWLMNAAFLHDLSGLLGFACMIVVLVFLRGVFARDSQWWRFAPHMILFLVIVVTAFVLLLSGGPDSFGIAQRVFVTIDVLWIGTVACGLLGTEPARRPEAPR